MYSLKEDIFVEIKFIDISELSTFEPVLFCDYYSEGRHFKKFEDLLNFLDIQ